MLGFKVDLRSFAKAETEVEQDRLAGITIRKDDVVGLHVPVNQLSSVTRTQDCEQFPCRIDCCAKLNLHLTLTPLAQRWTLDEFGHNIGFGLGLLPLMGIAFDQARNTPCIDRVVRSGLSEKAHSLF